MDNKLKQYQTTDILGKSKLELVVKVYDGAINNLTIAKDNYEKSNSTLGYEALEKAKKFVVHLYTTLDEEKGGEIAKNLAKLYAFVIEQVNFVQATKDLTKLESCITVLKNIREGWAELAERAKTNKDVTEKNPHESRPTSNLKLSV